MSFRLFPDEFSHLLEHVSNKQTGLIILGDYGNVDDKNASDLAAILHDTNLQQYVKSATQYRDNILDLVITPVTGSVLADVSGESLLTDHHVIVCKLVSHIPRPIRKEIPIVISRTLTGKSSPVTCWMRHELRLQPTILRHYVIGQVAASGFY